MPDVNRPRRRPSIEPLEPRTLLSSSFPNINISKTPGNQAEGSIVVDRADPSRLFAVSNIDVGDGLMTGISIDGGSTWSHKLIANDKDNLPPACCDPSVASDSFGNLFLAYLNSKGDQVEVLRSTDFGQTFALMTQFHGNVDQPTITTGPGSVWLTFDRNNGVAATGASVSGLGQVGLFQPIAANLPGSDGGAFGDVAVGPSGQVMVTYQKQVSHTLSKMFVSVDADGLGAGGFAKPTAVTTSHVTLFDYMPAQDTRGIDAEVGLAYDRSGGPFTGRAYMVYTDEIPAGSANTDIYVRYSDNGGTLWSNPIRVNDDAGLNSQLLPRISVDNTSGLVSVGWYDARNDLGNGALGDTDNISNDDVQYFATVITPQTDGLLVATNRQISAGTSNAFDANNSIDLGDYTGLDFDNGVVHPEWFDNSNSTGDNPNGTLKALNVYTANVPAGSFSTGPTYLGGLTDPSGPVAVLPSANGANPGFVRHGRTYTITVQYADAAGVVLPSVDSANLQITGPNSFSSAAQLLHARTRRGGIVLATYRLTNPTGAWKGANAGTYTISLQPGQVLDGKSKPSTGGILGTFAVATSVTGAHSGGGGPRHHARHQED